MFTPLRVTGVVVGSRTGRNPRPRFGWRGYSPRFVGRLDVLAPPPGSTVLDFGCGRGEVLDGLAGAGWTTYGVDPATKVAFRRHREVVDIPIRRPSTSSCCASA